MKFIGKALLTLLVLLILLIVALYIAAQTRWGAARISNWVTENSSWTMTLDGIDHSLSTPSRVTLQNVSLAPKGQQPVLSAREMVLDFGVQQLTAPRHFSGLLLRDGALNTHNRRSPLPVQADTLRLQNMLIAADNGDWNLRATQVDGGVTPWQPTRDHALGSNARFQFSAGTLTLNDIPAQNALIQGAVENNRLRLNNLGADVARGQLTADAEQQENGSWLVNNLRLSGVQWQTAQTLEQLKDRIQHLPDVTLGRMDVTGAKLVGPAWALSDLDITLQQVTLHNGDWQSEDGSLAFNASDIVVGNLHFIDPIVSTALSPAGIDIRQATARWEGGLLRADGNWQRADRRLTINDAAVVGLEYTLPQNWRELWQQPLPSWLNELILTKFSGSRNLIVDINPDYPFQFTAVDGFGNNLMLVKNGRWGIWRGGFTLNGSEATLNKTDIRRPSITLKADDGQITVTELSAFAGKGLLEGTATVGQQESRPFALTLNGRAVPSTVLAQWGWPAIPLSGDVNLQLSAAGRLQAGTPMKPTIGATLHAQDGNGQQVTQTLAGGELQAAMPQAQIPEAQQPAGE
ncbi:AsmA family protein [Enterobacillus tribolii]|uniref:AsmA-like protein n=1 Tax=Enterobacillus tribolii TaxID=1487935 RepID=A0A370QUJ2_9GAMM|nr:AsmA family protein [Enterobacillus tribolii]RDK92917.1 hypothetical protein C8D90_103310 [Enterobacillus tribolii]